MLSTYVPEDMRRILHDDRERIQHYKHTPLDTSLRQIRLLSIQSICASDHDPRNPSPIHCTLRTFNMDSAPSYIALSYMWGDPIPARKICIENQLYSIRDNLFHFLAAIRHTDMAGSYFWIDQICINQAETSERNHQVQLMSEIYKGCRHVIAWLGIPAAWKFSIEYSLPLSAMRQHVQSPLPELEIQQLHQNKYFTRLWIVQELRLAPLVHFLYGLWWISQSELKSVFASQDNSDMAISPAHRLIMELDIQNAPQRWAFQLETYSWMECQDARDKIYGLLGLKLDGARPVVDYTMSIFEVYFGTIVPLFADERTDYGNRVWDRDSHSEIEMYIDIGTAMGITGLDAFWRDIYRTRDRQANTLDIRLDPGEDENHGQIWYSVDGVRHVFDIRVGQMPSTSRRKATRNLPF